MAIDNFSGRYGFLSNFHQSQFVALFWDGTLVRLVPTVEHAFQAAKAKTVGELEYVLAAGTPGEAKKRGRTIEMRPDWDGIKMQIMHQFVSAKFNQSYELMLRLLATGKEYLREGNTWHDQIWGDCQCGRSACYYSGENRLGTTLMAVRKEARNVSDIITQQFEGL